MTQVSINNLPKHIAIVMDGNARWARERNLPKIIGYQKGIESAQKIIEYSKYLGIKYLTLYAFSLENWHRPIDEIERFMDIFSGYLKNDFNKLIKKGVRIIFIGDRSKLDKNIREVMGNLENDSLQNNYYVIIAISYGAKQDKKSDFKIKRNI